jgi:ATP-binding cassette, subfamily B, multidrug efflux pump
VQEKAQLKQFSGINNDYINKNMSLAKIRAGFFPGMRLLGGFGILILIWTGGHRVIQGTLSIGDLAALTMLHFMLFWPMIVLGWIVSIHQRGAASMKRIMKIFDTDAHAGETCETDYSITSLEDNIKINNLCFKYRNAEEYALKDISVEIPSGKMLGVSGPIGSGKTTLIRLLVRLYESPPDSIFIDGKDIRSIPLDLLRSHIAYVFQVPFLFSDTIHNNIAISNSEATREDVIRAAKKVCLHEEIISFTDGYETMLGERGINLSGGQKQRLALARALVRNPKILILDDTLSSVDTETESNILNMLRLEMKCRTSIVISHRLSSVMKADEIIFIDKGSIVERGTHEELLMKNGLYASIYDKQRLEEEVGKFEV